MNNETVHHVVTILNNTFKVIDDCYWNNQEPRKSEKHIALDSETESRLVFPRTRGKDELRISEQELRFVFIEQFNKYCTKKWNAYYSIETPTRRTYKFDEEVIKVDEKGCRSASIDVSIHNECGERICLIEFKAHNPAERCYEKDFVKLEKEPQIADNTVIGFFVQLLKAQDQGTMPNIKEKFKSYIDRVNYACHTLPIDKDSNGKTEYILQKSF